jgi:CBS domain-containing protein/sporulation protein YlmC with PRC-barrel domain
MTRSLLQRRPANEEAESPAFVSFFELLGRAVADADGEVVGCLHDLSIALGERLPAVKLLAVRPDRSRVLLLVEAWQVASWKDRPIRLSAPLSALRPALRGQEGELLLRETLLDKQVVDVSGGKVERVNDLFFLLADDHELRLAYIDVGLRGLVRRLGWQRPVDAAVSLVRPGARYLKREQLIGWQHVIPSLTDPAGLRLALSQTSLAKVHPADLAEILTDLPADSRRTVFEVLDLDTAARVLSEVDADLQEELLAPERNPEKAADLLESMPPDVAADVLDDLPPQDAEDLISRMQPQSAQAVKTLMHREEDTAAALMTTEFVALPGTLTIEEAHQALHTAAQEVEFLHQFYVVDENRHLLGYVPMRRYFLAQPASRLCDIMAPWSIQVHADDSVSEVASVIERYNLPAVPVLDADGVLVGMITVDDVLSETLPAAWQRKLRL